jgi:crotonobetainyl-CoA:carnitine CoA-transferase CaiB-like acyl-CoA transferase
MTASGDTAKGFLSGYRVLDMSDERGLLAGWMLARLGAEVIQVEPLEGSSARRMPPLADDAPEGQRSLYWSAYASGKRAVSCNLAAPAGRALLHELAARSDFLIESAGPGVMHGLGLDYASLRAANDALIYVSVSAFGSDGPKAHYAAPDLIVWAASGALWPSRDRAGTPVRISVPQAYLHAAADAAAGALIALFARHRSGQGQQVDISAQQSASLATLSTTLAAAVGHAHYQFPTSSPQRKRQVDMSGSGARTRRSKWAVRDGLLEMHLGVGPAAGWSANRMFAWMREEGALPEEFHDWDWIELPKRILAEEIGDADLERARAAVAAFVGRLSKRELMDIAMKRGILMAPAMTIEDLSHSEQLRGRAFYVSVTEDGRARTLPAHFTTGADGAFVPLSAAPVLGQHNDEIYGTLLGHSAQALARWRAEGVIG